MKVKALAGLMRRGEAQGDANYIGEKIAETVVRLLRKGKITGEAADALAPLALRYCSSRSAAGHPVDEGEAKP